MKLVRSGENEYRIEGLDRETLRDIATALLAHISKAGERGYYGYRFEPVIALIKMRNLERMRIKKADL